MPQSGGCAVRADLTSSATSDDRNSAVEIIRLLRERWWIPLACALACVAGAALVSSRDQPEYKATSRLVFRQFGVAAALFGSDVVAPTTDPARQLATNTELIESNEVANAVIRTLRLRMTPDQLLSMVKVENHSASDLADVTVVASRPEEALRIANAYAEQAVVVRRQADQAKVAYAKALLNQRLDALPATAVSQRRELATAVAKLVELQAVQTGNTEVASLAGAPAQATSQNTARNAAIAALLGLTLGFALAFALERLDPRLKAPEDVEDRFGLPVLARVPRRGTSTRTVQAFREAFRVLAAMLRFSADGERVNAVAVTSSGEKEGKTTVAFELALAAVEAGQRVVLVEGDVSNPGLHPLIGDALDVGAKRDGGASTKRGLTDYLSGRATIEDIVYRTSRPGLYFVPAGTVGPGEMMRLLESSQHGPTFLGDLGAWRAHRPPSEAEGEPTPRARGSRAGGRSKSQAPRDLPSLVLVDCPPVGSSADAVILATRADAVLLVVDLKRSTARAIDNALRRLRAGNVALLGAVVNREPTSTIVYRERTRRASPMQRPGLARLEVGRGTSDQ